MANLGEIYSALPEFRASLHQQRFEEGPFDTGAVTAFSAFVAAAETPLVVPAFSSPLTNVHATGVGIRTRRGEIVPDDFVIKVFVFSKFDLGDATPSITKSFNGLPVDVQQLPIQMALAKKPKGKEHSGDAQAEPADAAAASIPPNRDKARPIVGGVSIAPLDAPYVGTLGCFVQRRVAGIRQIFALSNNHVLANVNRLPQGTQIVQPGPERGSPTAADAFAVLSEFVPIRFPADRLQRVVNRYDAAIARVTDEASIKASAMLSVGDFNPKLSVAQPGRRVVKSGRTTGVTRGTILSVGANGIQVNYGTQASPIIATFNETIQIVGDGGQPFSLPGDSGSVILDEATLQPVALLFAGDGYTTTACSLPGVCRQLNVVPL